MNSTIQQLETERQKRDINKKDMSILVGYEYTTGWMQAVNQDHNPIDKIKKAKYVLDYYDKYGIIPTPQEVEHGRN